MSVMLTDVNSVPGGDWRSVLGDSVAFQGLELLWTWSFEKGLLGLEEVSSRERV